MSGDIVCIVKTQSSEVSFANKEEFLSILLLIRKTLEINYWSFVKKMGESELHV
jgi:hypothetical protein